MKLLLHTCCGPCFLGVWEDLKTLNIEVTNYFYNPNIQPEEEHALRLENLKKASLGRSKEVVEEYYDPGEHLKAISNHENEFPARCINCYKLRLEQAAKRAKADDYDAFSTTLLISPYQQHEELKKIGQEISRHYGVEFFYRDWRPFFREGQNAAKYMSLHRQRYCGCIFSKKEGA